LISIVLTHQQIAGPVQHQPALLLDRLDLDKTHLRLRNSLRISRVGLATLYVRLDIMR
jgi:hypothetical protein